jgi:hypothetical protein
MFLSQLNLFYPAAVAQAQRPTATPVPVDDDDESDAVPPLTGGVQGYVYNYSAGGAAQPGVTVVIDGGGWQAETVTDSSGFYRFAGLGASQAILNLRLPPEAHALTSDWPVFTGNPENDYTNLAFYWGDKAALPVSLSANPDEVFVSADQTFTLELRVDNHSSSPAEETVIDLKLPAATQALKATLTKGEIDFTDHRIWGLVGDLPAGESATLSIQIKFDQPTYPQRLSANATLTYATELAPQRLKIDLTAAETSLPASSTSAPAQQAKNSHSASPAKQPTAQAQNLMPETGEEPQSAAHSNTISTLAVLLIACLSSAGLATFYVRKQRVRGTE